MRPYGYACFLLLILSFLSISTTGLSQAENARSARLLSFPNKTSLGALFVAKPDIDWSKYDMIDLEQPPFTRLGKAQGQITIPKGIDLYFDLSYAAAQRPELLRAIPADALSGLRLAQLDTEEPAAAREAGRFTHLKVLEFRSTDLGDSDLELFSGLHKLLAFSVRDTEVTGRGLSILTSFPLLQSLSLDHTRVGVDGIKWAARCRNLRVLRLNHCDINDSELPYLSALSELRNLELQGNTGITAKGLMGLAQLKHLHYIALEETSIRGEDFKTMLALARQLPNLEALCLRDASFTPQRVAAWQAAMPHIRIAASQGREQSNNIRRADVGRLFAPLHSWSEK